MGLSSIASWLGEDCGDGEMDGELLRARPMENMAWKRPTRRENPNIALVTLFDMLKTEWQM